MTEKERPRDENANVWNNLHDHIICGPKNQEPFPIIESQYALDSFFSQFLYDFRHLGGAKTQ